MKKKNQSPMQVKIFGAPYGRDGESIGEAFSLEDAWQLADGNLTTDSQHVEVYGDDGEIVAKYARNDNDDVEEINA